MAREIERKFLLRGREWKALAEGDRCRQGYLNRLPERTVRVRTLGDRGYLTIKGLPTGLTRAEYEYEIPFADADAMLADLCEKPLIVKNRYRIKAGSHIWEIDEFLHENQGLVVAEVELTHQDESFEKPAWIGEEVTGDPRYFNSTLIRHPFTTW
jgi:CYTH domain-containing protein